jgi:eukaryotic-like serine/threonine-protein kinase
MNGHDGERPATDEAAAPPIGSTLAGRYRIGSLIAAGGMARVYRARDERLDRDVAVKILAAPYADDPAYSERFLSEARAAAGITHPSLVHVYDSGTDDGRHFIVMELLDRHRSLRQVLEERGRLEVGEALEMGRQLLAGLGAVHDRGLVHCDVKAANVMLGPGPAKLIDFGIARSPGDPASGRVSIGSLSYMSPEQLRGEGLAPASDLFSLGVVLHEAITGTLPFEGKTPEAVAAAHDAQGLRPPSALVGGISKRLDAAILQALRREPTARFHSARAMSVALEASAQEPGADTTAVDVPVPEAEPGYVPPPAPPPPEPVPRRPQAVARQAPPPRRRGSRRLAGLVGSALVISAAVLVVLFVVIPLLQLARSPTSDPGGASATAAASATPTPGGGTTVLVPNTIGKTKDEAISAATAAGLNWTIRCAEDASQPEGIIDQEPPADTEVQRGSRFTMYSARFSDCQ